MPISVERLDAREWPDHLMTALFAEGFPEFITADREAKRYIDRVRAWFAPLNIVLVEDGHTPVATGWGVPLRWSGRVDDLPTGYTDALRLAIALHEVDQEPDTLVICGAVVHPDKKGTGVAGQLMVELCRLAEDAGWPRVIAPVRPTLKHRYPLTPIDDYVAWTRDDGTPFDPWLRLHLRIGGRVLATAPTSQTMTGTIAQWETWTQMRFPASGEYVIPAGLSTLLIDRAADSGTYIEPNVWVRHRKPRRRNPEPCRVSDPRSDSECQQART